MPLTPYTGPFGRPELIHLLRRALFGVSPGDLAHFNGMSLAQVVDELLTFSPMAPPPVKAYWGLNGSTPDPSLIDPAVPFGTTWVNTPINIGTMMDANQKRMVSYASWWMGNMVHQERDLREKMTLFWFNHMPIQASTVPDGIMNHRFNALLRANCLGNFRQLIHDVTLEPAMLVYLNGFLNVNTAPDENYARELMELFTLGLGSGYTEDDVQAAARVLTGWTIQFQSAGSPIIPQAIFIPPLHETADKQFSAFFNNTVITGLSGPNAGSNELNALLDMIFDKEEVSLHVCREIYRFFVHGDIDPVVEADVIEPLAQLFRDNVGEADQMRMVMEALLTSEHFFSADVRACMVKSPADLIIGELRTFGMPVPDATALEAQYSVWRDTYGLLSYAGQTMADPPNVAGWPAYYLFPSYDNIWLDTATYPARNNALIGLTFTGFTTDLVTFEPQSSNVQVRFDLLAFVAQLSDPSDPNALIADVAELLFAVEVSQSVRDQLKQNYLLFGQTADYYWTDAYTTYVADPTTTDMAAQLVPDILKWLILDMQQAAEHHLH